jgi:AraC-like DNA-binding protein
MDGHTFVKALRGSMMLSHIPVVMLTASANDQEKMKSLEEGVDDYLTKPFNSRELQARVQNLIALRDRLRARYSLALDSEPGDEAVASAESVFLEKLRAAVLDHLGDEQFNGDALADELGVSLRQLQRKTKALTGETPNSFIRLVRLGRARQLVEGAFGSVADVAYAVGFSNPTYFTKCFREQFGRPPTEWLSTSGGTGEEATGQEGA